MTRLSAKLLCACFMFAAIDAHANVITTTFANNNNFDGNFFNVSTGANALQVTGMDVNVDTGSMVIDVYEKAGTYAGFERNAAAWTLVSQTTVTGQGAGNETSVGITPFVFSANALTGVYVTIDTNTNAAPYMYYTNGSNTYSNADLSIATGEGAGGLFGSLSVTSSRTWDGSFTYNVLQSTSVPEPAPLALFGIGVVGLVAARRRRQQ